MDFELYSNLGVYEVKMCTAGVNQYSDLFRYVR